MFKDLLSHQYATSGQAVIDEAHSILSMRRGVSDNLKHVELLLRVSRILQ
jgi:hypothetical protein